MADNPFAEIDRRNMYENLLEFPQQFMTGIDIGRSADLGKLEGASFDQVIVAGMGGSAIAGDLLRNALTGELNVPFAVSRDYVLPSHVNGISLVICSSYSGDTEETLSAFADARARGCRILCISTGGKLTELARHANVPCVKIPAGLMPREALGYSFAPLLVILGRLGICRNHQDDLRRCAKLLESSRPGYEHYSRNNRALALAEKLAGRIAVIYSSARLDSVGMRFKGQLCENGKQLAFSNVFPEFNHNELVGWELSSANGDGFIVIMLRDRDDHVRVVKRAETVAEILLAKQVKVEVIDSAGDTLLDRLFSLVQLADFTSYYVAIRNGVDPTPVDLIDYLKRKLSGNGEFR